MNAIPRCKPHYLRVSDKTLKQMLSNTLKDTGYDGDQLIRSLDIEEKLQFVRRMTEVTNHLYYFELQRELSQHYEDISSKRNYMRGSTGRRLSRSRTKKHDAHHQTQRSINKLNGYLLELNT